jgi:FixJ family two-component response regulator
MNPKVRIIAASGLNTSGMTARANHAGVNHFIAKPYTAEVLLTTLHQTLHGPD